MLFAFPPLLLALTLASVFTRNWFTVAVAIAIVYVPIFVRVTRGPGPLAAGGRLRPGRDGRSASRRDGPCSGTCCPTSRAIIIVQVTLSLSWAVLTEASLSFLGLGTPPPAPSLGSMVFDARRPWCRWRPGRCWRPAA